MHCYYSSKYTPYQYLFFYLTNDQADQQGPWASCTYNTVGDIGGETDILGHMIGAYSKGDNVGHYVGVSHLDSGCVLKSHTLVPHVQRSRNVSYVHGRL